MSGLSDADKEEGTRFYLGSWVNLRDKNAALIEAIAQKEKELESIPGRIESLKKLIIQAETELALKTQDVTKITRDLKVMRNGLLFGQEMEGELNSGPS